MYLKNLKKIVDDKFSILISDKKIFITEKLEIGRSYLSNSDILYSCFREDTEQKDIVKFLSKKSFLPDEINDFIQDRVGNLLGRELSLYGEKNNPLTFCSSEKVLSLYGFDDPVKFKLTVFDSFDNKDDFEKSFEDGFVYGFWDISENHISSSFIYGHPLSTQVCFPDFAKSSIEKGSLFLKLSVEEI